MTDRVRLIQEYVDTETNPSFNLGRTPAASINEEQKPIKVLGLHGHADIASKGDRRIEIFAQSEGRLTLVLSLHHIPVVNTAATLLIGSPMPEQTGVRLFAQYQVNGEWIKRFGRRLGNDIEMSLVVPNDAEKQHVGWEVWPRNAGDFVLPDINWNWFVSTPGTPHVCIVDTVNRLVEFNTLGDASH